MVSDKFQDGGQPEMVEEEPETKLLSLTARRGARSEYHTCIQLVVINCQPHTQH